MNKIENWTVIQLKDLVINGELNNRNIFTDKVLLVRDGYAVTTHAIYKLGEVDKVWKYTNEASTHLKVLA